MDRKVKDTWAKWHNLILKWDELNNETFLRFQKLLNVCTQIDHFLGPSLGKLEAVRDLKEIILSKLANERSQLESALKIARGSFLKLAGEMETLTQQLTSCEELLVSEAGEWLPHTPHPNFPSCTISHFRFISERLLSVYRKELHIKLILLRELPGAKTEDFKLLYLHCWSCEPFLDEDLSLNLNLILSILGLK